MGSTMKLLTTVVLFYVIGIVTVQAKDENSAPAKGKGFNNKIGAENTNEAKESRQGDSGVPEISHLMSNLVSLLPDDYENNLRKDGFTVLLDGGSKSEGNSKGPPSKNGGAQNKPLKPNSNNSPQKSSAFQQKLFPTKKQQQQQPEDAYVITMARVEKPNVRYSSSPVLHNHFLSKSNKPGAPGAKSSSKTQTFQGVDEISTVEIESKAQFATMKLHPPKDPPPAPKQKKVTKPIIILLEDIEHEGDSTDDRTYGQRSDRKSSSSNNNQNKDMPDLSALYHLISVLSKNNGAPVSVLPSSKSKELEKSGYCLKCTIEPIKSENSFDFDLLPQLILSDSGVNAMGTPFDVVGNKLVKRHTTK